MPGQYIGPFGEQNNTYAEPAGGNTGQWPLGHKLVLPDGREYRQTLNDGIAEVAGNLYQSVAPVANHTNVTADVARAAGVAVVSATLGATAAAQDIFTEGIVHINHAAGEGYAHRIARAVANDDANASASSSAVCTVNLAAGETVQVALTTASQMSFSRNRFHAVLIHPSPPTAMLAGVSPGVAAANRYYWSQVSGEAAVLADGTLLAGLPVQASVNTDGAVESHKRRIRSGSTAAADVTAFVALEDQDGSEVAAEVGTVAVDTTNDITGPISINAPLVGICVKANATTEYGLIDLLYLN